MLTFLFAAAIVKEANLRLPSIFGDGMVLQRRSKDPVFGTAEPGSDVEVSIAGRKYKTEADEAGKWSVSLDAMEAGGPYTLTIRAGQTVRFRNVMVGEVWLASGQSNMEYRVAWAANPAKEIANLSPDIRFFTAVRQSTETEAGDVPGKWAISTRLNVPQFSAIAYAFATELHAKLKVPIGIIHSSWGGTPIESWINRHTLAQNPDFAPMVSNYLASVPTFAQRRAEYEAKLAQYNDEVYKKDGENKGYHLGWADPDLSPAGWTPVEVPGPWELTQNLLIDGSVWYRKDVILPQEWTGKALRLELGPIADLDRTYFNGNQVGTTLENVRDASKVKRVYRVSPGLVRPGRNVIAVRVFNQFGDGGFMGELDDLRLSLWDGPSEAIPLGGSWLTKVETELEPAPASVVNQMPESPAGPGHPKAPGSLWNGMIAPLIPYTIKGVIWYQGESNAPHAYQYRKLFPMMISDWRKRWSSPQLPFYYVQLANFRARKPEPGESDWAELREAQALALKLPATAMTVTIDIGEAKDIHPKNKHEVGRRLALNALAKDYGMDVLRTGPIFRTARFEGPEVQVFFYAVGSRLATQDKGPVRGFAVAGADKQFYWANARISGSSVIVSSPKVKTPVAVRYAWADNPDCNLTNNSGLPASPFRTDDWPGITK